MNNVRALIPSILSFQHPQFWSSYDKEADVLYINFRKPAHADETELTDDDILVRYEKKSVIGYTILDAMKRFGKTT